MRRIIGGVALLIGAVYFAQGGDVHSLLALVQSMLGDLADVGRGLAVQAVDSRG